MTQRGMRSGQLNSIVRIQRPAATQDAAGQPTTGWTDVTTVWANVLHPNGAETIKAGKDVSIVQTSVRIRRRSGIDASMRVLHGTAAYTIRAVLPDEEKRDRMDLVCELVDG